MATLGTSFREPNNHGRGPTAEEPSAPVDLTGLTSLMRLTPGRPEVVIGMIDGPVAADHPGLATANMRTVPGANGGVCRESTSAACAHGTFVAGVLVARPASGAPAICPGCTLLVRPIFAETGSRSDQVPVATPEELADAIMECIAAGARILNLSIAVLRPSRTGQQRLADALDHAVRQGVIVIAAAGNQGVVGGAVLPALSWVIPVAACDAVGRPLGYSNLGSAIGRRGLIAPGDGIVSLDPRGGTRVFSGTSAAAPFVTGAAALLWSLCPQATAADVAAALTGACRSRRTTITPPLLDARRAYEDLVRRRQPVSAIGRHQLGSTGWFGNESRAAFNSTAREQ